MQAYTLGFLFSKDGNVVWLIRKKRPTWQAGLLNGVGGHIEKDESAIDAMIREFKEEAGLSIADWNHFCTISDDINYECYCYLAFSDEMPKTETEEEIVWYPTNCLPKDVVFNLHWMVPMALNFGERLKPYWVNEKFV